MKPPSIDLSLVIACYNDGDHLEDHLCEIENVLNQTRYTYEFVIIDDCSPDGSAKVVEASATKRAHARFVLHPQNVGRGGTVKEGFLMAEGRIVGFLDIDLEVHCRYIPAMILAIDDGADGATALRIYRLSWYPSFIFRHILSVGYRWLVRSILHLPYEDTETGYKFFARERILPILDKTKSNGWFWDTEIMALSHYHHVSVVEIPALFLRTDEKSSTVKPFQDSWVYLRELLRFRKRMKEENYL